MNTSPLRKKFMPFFGADYFVVRIVAFYEVDVAMASDNALQE
jgi:hypothetical protein